MRNSIQVQRPILADKLKPFFDMAVKVLDDLPFGEKSAFVIKAILDAEKNIKSEKG